MATDAYPAVDTDAHYLESVGDLAAYLDDDDPWGRRFREVTDSSDLFSSSTGDQRAYGRIARDDLDIPWPEEPMRPEDVPAVMDHVGVDRVVLLSHRMLSFARLQGGDARPVKIATAYVDYMLDKVVDPAEGIYTMVVAPHQDPAAAAELIDRVGDERGVVGVCMITAGAEPPLGHRRYDHIYAAAERKGLPVVFHSGGAGIDEFYLKGFEKFIETHTLGFLWNNMAQLTSVVVQGVPEKFPDLDVVFQESGVFWVPTMMHRLDAEYMKRQSEAPLLEAPPSEYVREFYFGTQPMEQPLTGERDLAEVVRMLGGPERLLYASDFPHWDYDPPSVIADRSFLSESEKRRILAGTAEEVFGV